LNNKYGEVDKTLKQFEIKRAEFLKLRLHEAINWEKYSLMSLSHHSTAIEGSSLTEDESFLLLDEGKTPKGKPLEHSLMEKDHYNALHFIVDEAKAKRSVTPAFIRAVSALVMKNTGGPISATAGNFDSSKGEYRKVSVFAGTTTFPNHQKVEKMVQELCDNLEGKLNKVSKTPDIYNLAFDFHYSLVSIHPFADGNGRISRLMMNFILLYHGLTPAIVHKEDKQDYINSLKESRNTESAVPLRKFLYSQLVKHFDKEIQKQLSGDKGISLLL
jgi:Fic family protein